jgi:hypothetical protein
MRSSRYGKGGFGGGFDGCDGGSAAAARWAAAAETLTFARAGLFRRWLRQDWAGLTGPVIFIFFQNLISAEIYILAPEVWSICFSQIIRDNLYLLSDPYNSLLL